MPPPAFMTTTLPWHSGHRFTSDVCRARRSVTGIRRQCGLPFSKLLISHSEFALVAARLTPSRRSRAASTLVWGDMHKILSFVEHRRGHRDRTLIACIFGDGELDESHARSFATGTAWTVRVVTSTRKSNTPSSSDTPCVFASGNGGNWVAHRVSLNLFLLEGSGRTRCFRSRSSVRSRRDECRVEDFDGSPE